MGKAEAPISEQFQLAWGKSSHSGQRLYDHGIWAARAAVHLLRASSALDRKLKDNLILATYIHDIGKLDADFQRMLEFAIKGDKDGMKSVRRVKHEANTLEDRYINLINGNIKDAAHSIAEVTGYEISEKHINVDDILTLATTHHGMFYVSTEMWQERDADNKPTGQEEQRLVVRRQWTVFYPREIKRQTLTDLLLRYHPLGGLVIVSDLVASSTWERERNLNEVLQGCTSLAGTINTLLDRDVSTLEHSYQAEQSRNIAVGSTLRLLLGGADWQEHEQMHEEGVQHEHEH
ncbi:MAG: hypothetical protein DLM69_01715 [Candidatus Chloroheliales bacterium]|nr:MAG: hypothetical protein DLM69_01715 [Chloroflexota bacterium]